MNTGIILVAAILNPVPSASGSDWGSVPYSSSIDSLTISAVIDAVLQRLASAERENINALVSVHP